MNRVVITGLGIVAPNAIGIDNFCEALKNQKNGIQFQERLRQLNFSCQIAGQPEISEELLNQNFSRLEQRGLKANGLIYGVIAGLEAWKNAGLKISSEAYLEEAGVLFGTGILGVDKLKEAFDLIENKQVRRLGSTSVVQTMASGISAFLGGKLGCGNQVSTNSSACTTGTESLLMAYERIKHGQAEIMLAGSCSDSGPYVWGGFDALRILPHQYNSSPESASRPFSESAAGFVPSSGAGAYVIESLTNAKKRNAPILAEILGGQINSGGQRNGGSMTAPNSKAVVSCIQKALKNAKLKSSAIDTINGHLTATAMDSTEIENWYHALGKPTNFPLINSLKSHIGHGLAASGSMELVASILQLNKGFVFGNRNAEDIHPKIEKLIGKKPIPLRTIERKLTYLAKASFGFGDVNACVLLKKFDDH